MAEDQNDSELSKMLVAVGTDSRLYELLFNVVQEAQAAGSVVQIITIWPATAGSEKGRDGMYPTKCAPSGACPK